MVCIIRCKILISLFIWKISKKSVVLSRPIRLLITRYQEVSHCRKTRPKAYILVLVSSRHNCKLVCLSTNCIC